LIARRGPVGVLPDLLALMQRRASTRSSVEVGVTAADDIALPVCLHTGDGGGLEGECRHPLVG
jgi:hypothetical protein